MKEILDRIKNLIEKTKNISLYNSTELHKLSSDFKEIVYCSYDRINMDRFNLVYDVYKFVINWTYNFFGYRMWHGLDELECHILAYENYVG